MPEYIISEKQLDLLIKNLSNVDNQLKENESHEQENNKEKLSEIESKNTPLKSIVSILFK